MIGRVRLAAHDDDGVDLDALLGERDDLPGAGGHHHRGTGEGAPPLDDEPELWGGQVDGDRPPEAARFVGTVEDLGRGVLGLGHEPDAQRARPGASP